MAAIKKTLWTLNVDSYAPRMAELTYPFLLAYARKIGADFRIIAKRRWPHMPAVHEKLQIFDLGRENDWNIYIDSDALIFPDMFDVTERVRKDTVVLYSRDFAGNRFRYDNNFRRDGRDIGACNWFAVASDWCIDLWRPIDDLILVRTNPSAVGCLIQPTTKERIAGIAPEHLIDDYIVSRNIARYGLKLKTVEQIQKEIGDPGKYAWHRHMIDVKAKIAEVEAGTSVFPEFRERAEAKNWTLATWIEKYGETAPAGSVVSTSSGTGTMYDGRRQAVERNL